jgi:hypothetical protein
MPNAASDILVGADQIADAFQRSPCTIRRWVKSGFLPHRRLPDGTVCTSLGAISSWILAGEPE